MTGTKAKRPHKASSNRRPPKSQRHSADLKRKASRPGSAPLRVTSERPPTRPPRAYARLPSERQGRNSPVANPEFWADEYLSMRTWNYIQNGTPTRAFIGSSETGEGNAELDRERATNIRTERDVVIGRDGGRVYPALQKAPSQARSSHRRGSHGSRPNHSRQGTATRESHSRYSEQHKHGKRKGHERPIKPSHAGCICCLI